MARPLREELFFAASLLKLFNIGFSKSIYIEYLDNKEKNIWKFQQFSAVFYLLIIIKIYLILTLKGRWYFTNEKDFALFMSP